MFLEVSRRLAKRGHDVTLLCSTQDPAMTRAEQGVTVVRAPRRATFLSAPIARLAAGIEGDADVVHVAATYPFTTPAVLRRAQQLRIPSVLDFHFEPAPSDAFGRLAAQVYRRIGPRAYSSCAVALVRSMAYGHSSPSLVGVPPDRWRVVPNGVDPDHFNANGPARAGEYVLFVGRLVSYKGVDVLLRAMARLPAGIPLYIAGDGPLRQALRAQARLLGVEVRFLGRVPDDELPALYRGALVTVLPSTNAQESFGITLLESMACGTPVVASRLPGVAEVATVGGLLAEPGDAASLARNLRTALRPGLLPRGAGLARTVHATYSWDAVTDRLETVYRELIGERQLPGMAPAPDAPFAATPGPRLV